MPTICEPRIFICLQLFFPICLGHKTHHFFPRVLGSKGNFSCIIFDPPMNPLPSGHNAIPSRIGSTTQLIYSTTGAEFHLRLTWEWHHAFNSCDFGINLSGVLFLKENPFQILPDRGHCNIYLPP